MKEDKNLNILVPGRKLILCFPIASGGHKSGLYNNNKCIINKFFYIGPGYERIKCLLSQKKNISRLTCQVMIHIIQT